MTPDPVRPIIPSPPVELSVVIVNFNAGRLLGECVASVRRFAGDVALELLVVDNASTDASLDVLREYPEVQCLRNPTNVGFARAVNQALAVAKGRDVLLLNPDTRIESPVLPPAPRLRRDASRRGHRGSKACEPGRDAPDVGVPLSHDGPGRRDHSRPQAARSRSLASRAGRPVARPLLWPARSPRDAPSGRSRHGRLHARATPGHRRNRRSRSALLSLLRGEGLLPAGARGRLRHLFRPVGGGGPRDRRLVARRPHDHRGRALPEHAAVPRQARGRGDAARPPRTLPGRRAGPAGRRPPSGRPPRHAGLVGGRRLRLPPGIDR